MFYEENDPSAEAEDKADGLLTDLRPQLWPQTEALLTEKISEKPD